MILIAKILTIFQYVLFYILAGDYTPTSTSLIGALQRNLSLSVRNLARDKEEDLRQLYSCWWSKPLPENIPYKKLLCFETKMLVYSHFFIKAGYSV